MKALTNGYPVAKEHFDKYFKFYYNKVNQVRVHEAAHDGSLTASSNGWFDL